MPDDDRSKRAGSSDGPGAGEGVDPEAVTRVAEEADEAAAGSAGAVPRTRVLDDGPVDLDAPTVIAGEAPPGESEAGAAPPAQGLLDGSDDLSEAETVVRPTAAAPAPGSGPARPDASAPGAEPVSVASPSAEPGSPAADAPPPAPAPSGIAPGSILFGEYEVIEVLGAGGMGEVYRARHRRLGEFRAIKMMHADLATKQGANEFFLREAKALLAVRHPAVVHCHDLLSDDRGRVYLIMEMIEGVSLSERLAEGALPADEVVLLGARLAAGLEAAHACGVVHRDVSPDNVVLPDGDVTNAKLIDFGIAKILEEGQGTILDGFKGKLGYASPEQLGFFGGRIDGRSDFYSLGLVLCAAALGRPMGMGTTVVEAVDARRSFQHVPDEIPVGLRSAIEPLLALDPRDRPAHVERLFLAPGADQPGLAAIRAEGRRPAASRARGAPWAARLAIAFAAVAVGVGGYLFFAGGDASAPGEGASAPGTATSTPAPGAAAAAVAPARTSEPEAAAPAAPARATALDAVRIVGLLRGAEAALAENRLQSPKGDNAYEKYRAVLEIDPGNEAARDGLVAVAGRYLALSRRALSRSDVEQARVYLARAASIAPHHPDLDTVRAEVDAAGEAS